VRKILPETMFADPKRSRLTMLRSWVLDHEVSEIEMTERQFWIFAQLQPVAEKPWTTFMGRVICVPDMPIEVQKQVGILHGRIPGAIMGERLTVSVRYNETGGLFLKDQGGGKRGCGRLGSITQLCSARQFQHCSHCRFVRAAKAARGGH
jgi:hypothetical protein